MSYTATLITAVVLALIGSTSAQQSADGQLQQTLGKIVFAHQLYTVNHISVVSANKETQAELTKALNDERLELTASDVESGTVASIADRTLSDLVTLPGDKTLSVTHASLDVGVNGKDVGTQDMAQVEWAPSTPNTRASYYTLKQIIQQDAGSASCASYTSATITATYKGQSAQWKALYLLGCADGVQAMDNMMGGAVAQFWNANVYPYAFVTRPAGRNEAVQAWLRENASADCQTKTVCFSAGRVQIPSGDIMQEHRPTPS